ncbi:hypothetical protein KKB69_00765 [Patescibacteria group bacterium]|nr:hypothetical protein [Patescibacteria group bacterium]
MKIKNLNQGACPEHSRGAVSIIVSVMLLSILLVVGMGVSALMLGQARMSSQIGDSVVAIYAADAGAERCLYQVFCIQDITPTDECIAEVGVGLDQGCAGGGIISEIINPSLGISYNAEYDGLNTILSEGQYRSATRALELSF